MSGSKGPIDTSTLQMSSGANASPTSFGYYPPEGSRVVATRYNFSTQTGYFEDLSFAKAMGIETNIQSIYIDNSQNTQPVTIQIEGTNQFIIIPANYLAIMPAFFTDNAAMFISTPSLGGYTRCHFLNVPCGGAQVWPASAVPAAQNGSQVAQSALLGTQYFSGTAAGTGNNAIIPAQAGLRWFLSSITIWMNPLVTIAGGAEFNAYIKDGPTTNIFQLPAWAPSAASTNPGAITLYSASGLNLISQSVGQALYLSLSGALLTGNIVASAFGGYTANTP